MKDDVRAVQELRDEFPIVPLTEEQVVAYVRRQFETRRRLWSPSLPDLIVFVVTGPEFVKKTDVEQVDCMAFAVGNKNAAAVACGALLHMAAEMPPVGLPPQLEIAADAVDDCVDAWFAARRQKGGDVV